MRSSRAAVVWRALAAAWFAVTTGGAASALLANDNSSELEPLVTSATEFNIPFAIDPALGATQVELLVSSDHGRSWNPLQTVAPSAGKFLFRAPFNGEFWFYIRTLDAQGKSDAAAEIEPELKVIVSALDRAQFTAAPAALDRALPASNETPIEEAFTLPPGLKPRMVNSHTVDIDYEAPAAPRGPREIAVWLTRDGGQTWKRHRLDEDCKSPVRVTFDSDGLYGLWIVMTDADGKRAPEPVAGDEPGVWIGVDTVSPRARLLTADAQMVRGQRELAVRWEASDARLALAPVTLSYRRSPDEPWAIWGSQLLNTGSHTFTLTANAPETVQLRLEVLDEAGNLGVFETSEPVSTTARSAYVGPRDHATLRGSRTFQVLR